MTPLQLNNRYRVLQVLGTGGFGETFLAEDAHMPSGRLCAIKHLKPLTVEPQVYKIIQERFHREAAILEALGDRHSQIPTLYAYFEEGGEFYLVQEWIPGTTLRQKLQLLGRLSEPTVREILVSLLQVLDYAHAQGVIHRDIKPENVILRQSDGAPVLIDFGIAKEMMGTIATPSSLAPNSIVGGTPGFMPMEQALGKTVYASDLYSLGLTAINLLTGCLPHQLPTDPTTGEFNWQEFDLNVSPAFATILKKSVRHHFSDRYPTAKAMLAALNIETSASSIAQLLPGDSALSTTMMTPAPTVVTPPPIAPATVSGRSSLPNRDDYRNCRILLNKVKNYWIKGVLETSLHDRAVMELGLEARPDAIEHPWKVVWQDADHTRLPLSASVRLLDKFDELGMGRTLLILGDPGSGKTTMLLELARDLITRAETDTDHPIPVVFNLSSWSGQKQSIADWLILELSIKYQVSKEIGRNWISQQRLLLLLDGLDEVNINRRSRCVQAVNHFSLEYGQTEMVVCSRVRDYEALTAQLRFQAAVYLQPLTLPQIQHYLAQTPGMTSLSRSLETDVTLQELVQSPLMLSIMTLAYQDGAIDLQPDQSLEQRRHHLFEAYIATMLNRRGISATYPYAQVQHWLSWLAKQLTQESQTIFLIEQIQPRWIDRANRWQYALGVGLIGGGAIGLGGGFNTEFIFGNGVGILGGAVLGLSGGIIAALLFGRIMQQIEPVATLKWSWKKAEETLPLGLRIGILVGIVIGLSSGAIMVLISGNLSAMIEGLAYGFSGFGTGLVFILMRGLTGSTIEITTLPNWGMHQSAKNALVFTLIGVLTLTTVAYVLGAPAIAGAVVGLLVGLYSPAGLACMQHLTLRLILWRKGAMPWNYARFLDYATQLILLQKVGGGYIFIHRLLLEHFAAEFGGDRPHR